MPAKNDVPEWAQSPPRKGDDLWDMPLEGGMGGGGGDMSDWGMFHLGDLKAAEKALEGGMSLDDYVKQTQKGNEMMGGFSFADEGEEEDATFAKGFGRFARQAEETIASRPAPVPGKLNSFMEPLEPPREARQEKGKGKGKGKEGGAAAAAVHAAAAAAAASAASSNAEGRHLLQLLQAGSPGGKGIPGLGFGDGGKGKAPFRDDDDEPRGAPRFDGKGEARGDES